MNMNNFVMIEKWKTEMISLPTIAESTVSNTLNDVERDDIVRYTVRKLEEIRKDNFNLFEIIDKLADEIANDEHSYNNKTLLKMKCVYQTVIILSLINCQIEVDELKEMFS